MMNFETARIKMVENQIRTTDVTSHPVISAFLSVPREAFLPPEMKALAYIDEDIPVKAATPESPARYMMEPSPLAKLVQLMDVDKEDVVLVVGAGEGYASAILSLLAGSVVAVESDADLAEAASQNFLELGYDNAAVVTGPLEEGCPSEAPYDVIFINGAVEYVPEAILEQLREGGRLVCVEGFGHAARAKVFRREDDIFSDTAFFNAAVKPLPGFVRPKEFVF
ncbi:protein-L-isoaspartate O-methyltransferase family protein [Martelella endophytica]|uniref:Protein-L-isoaspartate O-methyltransferase n=1 Tax=Martelella endophytica TaxID=1486262 RepID=A0A0D5LXS8_MAREN|nr:protein-L-isoaspartate O-methyltransferase [Martelella endophytica]AJY48263.1 protein-L-isoaspartate O-methyltransferase [Martelella endophytica]